jgi:hypothetical protein
MSTVISDRVNQVEIALEEMLNHELTRDQLIQNVRHQISAAYTEGYRDGVKGIEPLDILA